MSRTRSGRPALLLITLLAALPAGAMATCPLGEAQGNLLQGSVVSAAWQVAQTPIQVSVPFSLFVRTCPADTELIAVDASMPAHRHGMNYTPSITAMAPGQWRVEGLIWHMPGQWELTLDLRSGGQGAPIERLRQAVMLR